MPVVLLLIYFVGHLIGQGVIERLATRARRLAEDDAPPGASPPVTLVIPVYGADRFTESCIRGWLSQRYAGPIQFVFAGQDEGDPALAVLDRFQGDHSFERVVRPVSPGLTGKGSNLTNGIAAARHETIILGNHDILAGPDTVARVVARLEAGYDLVSCLPAYRNHGNLPARVYVLFWNMAIYYGWAPSFVVGGVRSIWGSVVGTRRRVLDSMGGMRPLAEHLAEDMEMGSRAHRLGLRVALGPRVESPVEDMTWAETQGKFSVLSFIGYQQNPWGRVGNALFFSLFYGYLPAVVVALFLGPVSTTAAILFLLGRGLFLGRLGAFAESSFRFPWEFPLMDAMHAAAIIKVYATKKTKWGKQTLRAERDGKIRAES